MKYIACLASIAVIFISMAAAYASGDKRPCGDQVIEVGAQSPQETALVALSKGETVEFKIESNPSTGYTWIISGVDESVLEPVLDDFTPNSDAIGAGGTRTLIYRGIAAGSMELTLTHCRPWDCENTTLKKFTADIKVH